MLCVDIFDWSLLIVWMSGLFLIRLRRIKLSLSFDNKLNALFFVLLIVRLDFEFLMKLLCYFLILVMILYLVFVL